MKNRTYVRKNKRDQNLPSLMATVDSLPDSIIVQILSFFSYPRLVKASEVCKRWYRLSFDPSLWMKFSVFKKHTEKVTNDVIERIISRRNNFIYSIDLKDCQGITDGALERIALDCPRLKSLILRGCDLITDRAVSVLARNCSSLEKLDIPLENVSDESLSAVVENNSHLTQLYAYSRAVTPKTMAALASNCGQLEKLVVYVAPLKFNEPSSMDVLTDEMVGTLARGCQLLSKLTLRYNQVMLTDTALIVLAKKCPKLKSLRVDYCDRNRGITNLGVCALAQLCKELKSLRLSNGDITDASLVFISEHLHDIKDLSFEFSEVTDVGVYSLFLKCDNLERLVVHNSDVSLRGITDASAYVIANFSSTAFRSLGLGFAEITDEGLKVICRNTILKSLSINGCSNLTFDGLKACFGDLCCLHCLDISFTDIIVEDEQLIQIGEALENLIALDITDCFGISNSCIKDFREKFPKCELSM